MKMDIEKYFEFRQKNLKRGLKHEISQKEYFDILQQAKEHIYEIKIPDEGEKKIEKSILGLVEQLTKKI